MTEPPDHLALSGSDGAANLAVRVAPRAGRTALDGVNEAGALRVRLAAPPVGGAANEALIGFLADLLALPKRAITLLHGHHSRDKIVQIAAPLSLIRERLRAAADRSAR